MPAQGIEKNVRAPRRALLAVPSVAEPRRAMSRRSVSGPPEEGQHRTIDWPGGFSSWQCKKVCSTELFRAYFTRRFICVSSSAMCGSSGIPPAERSKTIRSRLAAGGGQSIGPRGACRLQLVAGSAPMGIGAVDDLIRPAMTTALPRSISSVTAVLTAGFRGW